MSGRSSRPASRWRLPDGYAAFVHPRSGLAARLGVGIVNTPGTVDAGYRGEVKVVLVNLDPTATVVLSAGDRIAQLVIQRVERAQFSEVSDLPGSVRDEGGFGSTGTSPVRAGDVLMFRRAKNYDAGEKFLGRAPGGRRAGAGRPTRSQPAADGPAASDFDRPSGGAARGGRAVRLGDVDRDGLAASGQYLDLGSLLVRVPDGAELRLPVSEEDQRVLGALLVLPDSAVELSVFAAPRSGGLWEQVAARSPRTRSQLAAPPRQGVQPHGLELRLAVPGDDGARVSSSGSGDSTGRAGCSGPTSSGPRRRRQWPGGDSLAAGRDRGDPRKCADGPARAAAAEAARRTDADRSRRKPDPIPSDRAGH